ncbi:hypothetical protein H5410_004112, partial [Solanum commersonii]
NEIVPKNMHYMHTHTFEQRRQNWIINNISRPGGLIIDYVSFLLNNLYVSLPTKSIMSTFIWRQIKIPEITKKSRENEETTQVTPRRKPHVRGKKLIKNYVVGTCTKSYNGVYIKNRGEANYLSERDIPSNIGKLVTIYIGIIVVVFTFIIFSFVDFYNFVIFLWPKKKRKRGNEYLYGHQQVNLGDDATRVNSGDATLSTPMKFFFSFGILSSYLRYTMEIFPRKIVI